MIPKLIQYRRLKVRVKQAQAWMRRTYIRNQYVRLLVATKIVQTYFRRYSAQVKKWQMLRREWEMMEVMMTSAILVQCRFRIYAAKKRVKLILRKTELEENAALAIQRNWFNFREEYSTFFLMSAYRARKTLDGIERKIRKAKATAGTVAKIQKAFRKYIKWKFNRAAIIMQKYYRRLTGSRYTVLLRRRRIAGRKIRWWLKSAMKRRHVNARTIQRIWWSRKAGRLLRHLYGT